MTFAVLEKHVIPGRLGFSLSLSYSVSIPYADRSDAYMDSIPNPDFVFFLTCAHSFLEKGLKYLCMISDPNASYSRVRRPRSRYPEDVASCFSKTPAGASLERSLRDHDEWSYSPHCRESTSRTPLP